MNKEVEKYIEKQKSPQREICRKLREIILNKIVEGGGEEISAYAKFAYKMR